MTDTPHAADARPRAQPTTARRPALVREPGSARELVPVLLQLALGPRVTVRVARDAPREQERRRELAKLGVVLEPLAHLLHAIGVELLVEILGEQLQVAARHDAGVP